MKDNRTRDAKGSTPTEAAQTWADDADPAFALEAISSQTINRELLDELVQTRMPFGRFKGRPLIELPEPYVLWLHQQQPIEGRIGQQLLSLYEIKVNGLEVLLRPLLRGQPDDDV